MRKLSLDLVGYLLSLPRIIKRLLALSLDVNLCIFSVWLAYYLRLGNLIGLTDPVIFASVISVAIAIPVFIANGLYRSIFRYSGSPVLFMVARAVCVYAIFYFGVFTVYGFAGVPRTLGIIQPVTLFILIGISRMIVGAWLGSRYRGLLKHPFRENTLVYGAGASGQQIGRAMRSSPSINIVGFVDDDVHLHGNLINGLPVYSPEFLKKLVDEHKVSSVLLAMPGIGRRRRNEIISKIRSIRVSVRTLPSLTDLASGKVTISNIQELDLDDLLGRETVLADNQLLSKNVLDKTVVVSGAGGSIGSELCKQILDQKPAKLLLIEQSEFALYQVNSLLEKQMVSQDVEIIPLLASVCNFERMREIFSNWKPNTIYHAAAFKHVPLVEQNLGEGIKNNVFGTYNLARLAISNGVSNFVLISTDKAVRPTNMMGASKRLAEMILQSFAKLSDSTIFCMVRFGNVLGSSGSVVPKFREQIRHGGPVTLTHPEVTRFFMSVKEAAQLVIQAGAMAKGGEVFVLDMGDAVKIRDLAVRIIELSGLTLQNDEHPEGDIAIEIIGLRPGEKLYEELLITNKSEQTYHPKIMKAHEDFLEWDRLESYLQLIEETVVEADAEKIREIVAKVVVGYVPDSRIADLVYLNNIQGHS